MSSVLNRCSLETAAAIAGFAAGPDDAVGFLTAWGQQRDAGHPLEEPWGEIGLGDHFRRRFGRLAWSDVWHGQLQQRLPLPAPKPLPQHVPPAEILSGVTRFWAEQLTPDLVFAERSFAALKHYVSSVSPVPNAYRLQHHNVDMFARPFSAQEITYSCWIAGQRLNRDRAHFETDEALSSLSSPVAWLHAVWPLQRARDEARVRTQTLQANSVFEPTDVAGYPHFETHFALPCVRDPSYLSMLDAMPWLNGTITLYKTMLFNDDIEHVLPALLARMPYSQRVHIADLPRFERITQLGKALFHLPHVRTVNCVRCPDLYDLNGLDETIPPWVHVMVFEFCPRIDKPFASPAPLVLARWRKQDRAPFEMTLRRRSDNRLLRA